MLQIVSIHQVPYVLPQKLRYFEIWVDGVLPYRKVRGPILVDEKQYINYRC